MFIDNRETIQKLLHIYLEFHEDALEDKDFFEMHAYNKAKSIEVKFRDDYIVYHFKHRNGNSGSFTMDNKYKDKVLEAIHGN